MKLGVGKEQEYLAGAGQVVLPLRLAGKQPSLLFNVQSYRSSLYDIVILCLPSYMELL